MGCPPWRVWFELTRPYYVARVWETPIHEGRKTAIFTQVDKEMWSGHETRQIVYDSDESARRAVLRMRGPVCSHGAGADWTTYTNLGLGFYAEEVVSSYGELCPKNE